MMMYRAWKNGKAELYASDRWIGYVPDVLEYDICGEWVTIAIKGKYLTQKKGGEENQGRTDRC
jgi:hypothetical protein